MIEELERIKMDPPGNINQLAVETLLLKFMDERSVTSIAEQLNISERQVQRYIKNFQTNGIKSCFRNPMGRPQKGENDQEFALAKSITSQHPGKSGFLLDFWTPTMLEQALGIPFNRCSRLLKRLNSHQSETGAILSTKGKTLESYLKKLLEDDHHIWMVHHFCVGDDTNLKSRFIWNPKKEYHVFVLFPFHGENFKIHVAPIEKRTLPDELNKRYSKFLDQLCNRICSESGEYKEIKRGRNPKIITNMLLLRWTPLNRHIVCSSPLAAQQRARHKVICRFLPRVGSFTMFDIFKELEKEMHKKWSTFRTAEDPISKELRSTAREELQKHIERHT